MNNELAVDPVADRLVYAAFPLALKDAMKIAARRNAWDRGTWALQTTILHEAMLAGRYDADELAEAYRDPPRSDSTERAPLPTGFIAGFKEIDPCPCS